MSRMSKSLSGMDDWRSRLFGSQLVRCDRVDEKSDFELVSTEDSLKKDNKEADSSGDDIYGVYFSFANISVDSDDFTKTLAEFYKKYSEGDRKTKFEVVQVVLWTHTDVIVDYEATFRRNIIDLPWFAITFSDVETKVSFSNVLI
jgi:hypothetical protein